MYFKTGDGYSGDMSPKVLQDCNGLFYIMNTLFVAAILGYLIYKNVNHN